MTETTKKPFKLNIKRTLLIGFAFFGILLLWQVYDSYCPTFLTELFVNAKYPDFADLSIAEQNLLRENVQYLVGVIMALDNLAALILLPIFGKLSDKTHSKIGKRMPYILVGTFVCAVVFPFIPLLVHYQQIVGTIVAMGVVILFAMMYRNPAVALMPDITPKPLRSKANGIINIMGYIGGALATVAGLVFVVSDYYGTTMKDGVLKEFTWAHGNLWAIETPFIIASIFMLVSALVLFFTIKENKVAEEMKDEMVRGELEAEVVDEVKEESLTKANKFMLIVILIAEFFWFMADNGISTFFVEYTRQFLGASSSSAMVSTIVSGVGSVLGFAIGGIIASKLTRKWTLISGLGITLFGYALWSILTFTIPGLKGSGSFPLWLTIIWFIKGFGMSLVHVNSFPMVVELCPNSKIGAYTGYYYASSMAAQTITPVLLGLLLLTEGFKWEFVSVYAFVCLAISFAIFFLVKNVKNRKTDFKKGLEALGQDD